MGRLAFEHPLWLLLALGAVPLLIIGWRRFGSMSRARRVSAIAFRALLATLLAGLLAGASWVGQTRNVSVILVADLSESVRTFGASERVDPESGASQRLDASERIGAALRDVANARGADDRVGLVVFGARPLASVLPTRGNIEQATLDLDVGDGSDLASALRFAASLSPADTATRLVLLSDGAQTTGDSLREASRLVASGASATGSRLDVAPVRYRVEREVVLESLDLPPRAPSESRVTARVTLRSTGPARGRVSLLRDGQPVPLASPAGALSRAVTLRDGVTTLLLPVDLPPGRVHRLDAVFEPEGDASVDRIVANNLASAVTLSPGDGAVLLIDGSGGRGGRLAQVLREADLRVDVRAPVAAPIDLLDFEAYDLVLLLDVPVDALPERTPSAMAAYVRDLGGGLAMIGGRQSFGAGGWKGSDIEPILPVSLDLPERLVAPEAAIVFVLDSSGSMGWPVMGSSRTKQQIVNDATALAVRSMDQRDLAGVIAFDLAPRVVVPLAINENPDRSIARIRSISAGGGTNIGPALDEAQRQLVASDAKIKHVILLSDGQSMSPEVLPGMAAQMRRDGIRVSTIAVGEEADLPTMRAIADQGDGAFYEVLNPNRLPRVFIKAVRIVRTPLIREGAFEPALIRPDDALAGTLNASPAPPLGGLVLTTDRPEPSVRTILTTPEGEPVLAAWRVGLGQVAAFTSDVGVWSEEWIDAGVFDRFWTNLARSIAREGPTSPADLRLSVEGDRLRLRVEMTDDRGAPRDGLAVRATVYGPEGDASEVTLVPSAPGVYEGASIASTTGVHVAVVKARDGDRDLAPTLAGVSVSNSNELRRLESDDALMERLAAAGGGRVLDLDAFDAEALFDVGELPPRVAATPLWPMLLVWTIACALLDVGTRRIAWDRWLSPQFGGGLREEMRRSVADRGRSASGALSGLRRTLELDEPESPSPISLGRQDAEAASRSQVEKMRAERIAEMRAQAKARKRSAPVIEPPIEQATKEVDGAEGLLAAKRRARQRYESEDEIT